MTAMADLPRRLAAEAIGTMLLVVTVVGSGIMAERLTGDAALMLLANTLATAAILVVLITILGPVSGAHFNPSVSLVLAMRRRMSWRDACLYGVAQIAAGVFGTMLAHAMFALPWLQTSLKARSGDGQYLSEGVATFGLLLTVMAGRRVASASVGWLVGLYIAAAYWFTASTSFANPAVSIARAFTNTFAGIRPADLGGFIAAQVVGALAALALAQWLLEGRRIAVPAVPEAGAASRPQTNP
jgi:glycerol uptake facilitator-like aquaporin